MTAIQAILWAHVPMINEWYEIMQDHDLALAQFFCHQVTSARKFGQIMWARKPLEWNTPSAGQQ